MGEIYFCEMCGLTLPTRESLVPVTVGKDKAGEVCINCSNNLKNSISAQRNKIILARKAAADAYDKQKADEKKAADEAAKAAAAPAAEDSHEGAVPDEQRG